MLYKRIRLYNNTRALSYLGTLILKSEASKIMPYNILDIENYLKGVVPYEMSDYYPLEALKAVDATRGMVLLNNSVLVETLYSASHGGYTDYLRSKPDAFENELWPNGDVFLSGQQIGAKNRAQARQAFEEILKFYYNGTYLETIPSQVVDSGSGETETPGTPPGTDNQTPQSNIPEVKLLAQPNAKYKPGETISLSVASPNYSGKVEYRVIIYNGKTKISTQFYSTPATGFYNTSGQQAGNSNYLINIPVKNMTAGPYSITILARKAGTSVPYDSFVKTEAIWIRN